MPDEIGWLTDEEEAILDRVAALVAAERSKPRPPSWRPSANDPTAPVMNAAVSSAQDAAADLPT